VKASEATMNEGFEMGNYHSLTQFYKKDTSPPKVVELLPGDDAIAVDTDVNVSIVLADEKEIETDSIIF